MHEAEREDTRNERSGLAIIQTRPSLDVIRCREDVLQIIEEERQRRCDEFAALITQRLANPYRMPPETAERLRDIPGRDHGMPDNERSGLTGSPEFLSWLRESSAQAPPSDGAFEALQRLGALLVARPEVLEAIERLPDQSPPAAK